MTVGTNTTISVHHSSGQPTWLHRNVGHLLSMAYPPTTHMEHYCTAYNKNKLAPAGVKLFLTITNPELSPITDDVT